MNTDIYTYSIGNLLDEPNTYFYSTYHGAEFIEAWRSSRAKAIDKLSSINIEPDEKVEGSKDSNDLLETGIVGELNSGVSAFALEKKYLEILRKKFEISKRIYNKYDSNLKPIKESNYNNINYYVQLSKILTDVYSDNRDIAYLNTLLKVNDTIISSIDILTSSLASKVKEGLIKEMEYVQELLTRFNLSSNVF